MPAIAGPMTRPRLYCASSRRRGTEVFRGDEIGDDRLVGWASRPPGDPDKNTMTVTMSGFAWSSAASAVRSAGQRHLDRGAEHDEPAARETGRERATEDADDREGRNAAAATVPVQPAFPVCSVTSTPTPIVSIHVPTLETNAPVQMRAYLRLA